CALDALGEESGLPRFVPLARDGDREHYGLTLAKPGNPEYRLFDVVRTKDGDALVSNRRTQSAPTIQRIHVTRCVCGGRLHERDLFFDEYAKKLSRYHAAVFVAEGELYVKDMGSRNGTWVNGVKISEDHRRLAPADLVKLGDRGPVMRFELAPDDSATPP